MEIAPPIAKVNHGREAESHGRQQEEHPEECTGGEREEEEAWDGEVGVGEGGAGEGQAKQRGKEVSAGYMQRLLTLCWENTEVPGGFSDQEGKATGW